MTSSPPVRPAYATVHIWLGGAGCILPFTIGANTSISLTCSAPRDPSCGRMDILSCSSHADAQTVSKPNRCHPSLELMEDTLLGGATLVAAMGGPPHPKKWETPPWFKSLKPSCADAFLRDSDMVAEARLLFFSKHSCHFSQVGNCNLSKVFKKLAKKAGLLGTGIYKIQACWTGPKELKQANYTLQSLPKGLKFFRAVPATESPSHGINGYPWPRCPSTFCQFHLLPMVWEGRSKWRDGSQPPKNYTLQTRLSVW